MQIAQYILDDGGDYTIHFVTVVLFRFRVNFQYEVVFGSICHVEK